MRFVIVFLLTLSLHYLVELPNDRYLYYVAAASWSALYCLVILRLTVVRESVMLACVELAAILYVLATVIEIGLAPKSIWLRNHYADIMHFMFWCEIMILMIGGVRYGFNHISGLWVDFHHILSSLHRYLRNYRLTKCYYTR
jgi:hypothetical protein